MIDQSGSHGECDLAASLHGLSQVVGELELHAAAAAHAIADVLRIATRVAMTVNAMRESGFFETRFHERAEIRVEASDVYVRLALATVHGYGDIAHSGQRQALGMIELMAGDVQVPVAPVRFEPFEGEQAVIVSCDERGDLGGADFDATAMGSQNNDRGMGPVEHRDLIVATADLMLIQVREATVAVRHGGIVARVPESLCE
ncbi:MAG TPA: hypothetical protein VGM84_18455 [Steroidobacteraceae bacterium]